MLLAAIGVTVFMLVSVIPKLQVFLAALGRKLPAMTQFLVDLCRPGCRSRCRMWLGGLATLTGVAIAVYSWPPGRYWVDRCMLRVPIFGVLFRLGGDGNVFAQPRHLDPQRHHPSRRRCGPSSICIAIVISREQVASARDSVMQGGTLAEPLRMRHAFMPMLSAMVAVGESTGTLDDVLDEVARFHESQLQVAIRRFSIMIEPAIIVVVGGIVGFVYISFFVALFSAAGQVR